MIKDVVKYIRFKPVIVFMILPIGLDIIALILALHGMAGGLISESLINFIFSLANWPSILFKVSPFDNINYEMFDSFYPRVIILNVFGWGLIGFIYCLLTEGRKKHDESSS